MATSLSAKDKKIRVDHMKTLGAWLKENDRTQKWAAYQLGIYSGYLSNLCTGKQVASEKVCRAAGNLMGPLNVETGECIGPAWTEVERRDERNRRQKAKRAAKRSKAVSRRRTPKPEEMRATCDIVVALCKAETMMTTDELVDVTRSILRGFRT